MKLSDYKIDPVKLEQGDWVENIPEMGDLRLKVRGIGNKAAERLQRQLTDAVPRARKVGGRPVPEENERIFAQVMLNCILLDWDNLKDDDGAPIPYSREMAETLLTEPQYREFRNAVAWAANVVADAAAKERETAAKN